MTAPTCYRCGQPMSPRGECGCPDGICLVHGKCEEVVPQLEASVFDSIVTDPPYGLEFMGKSWDHGVPGVPFWEEFLRVCKPGAMLLSFGGTRTWHRLAVCIEDAGWIVRDTLCWLYGSGFPKSLDVSAALDRDACRAELTERLGRPPTKAEFKAAWEGFREVVSKQKLSGTARVRKSGGSPMYDYANKELTIEVDITAPATEAAKLWDGWGTALKPAWEPVILAMKPLDGTFAENAEKWGVAGLNVDGGRVSLEAGLDMNAKQRRNNIGGGGYKPGVSGKTIHTDIQTYKAEGRWPANVILSHANGCRCVGTKKVKGSNFGGSDTGRINEVFGEDNRPRPPAGYASPDGQEEVEAWECVDGCPIKMLDEQSGESISTRAATTKLKQRQDNNIYGKGLGTIAPDNTYGDTGGASRFFYCGKASGRDRGNQPAESAGPLFPGDEIPEFRNTHPTVKPLALMEYLCRLTATPTGGMILDPFAGSGTTGVAARAEGRPCLLIEQEEKYCCIAAERLRQEVLF